MKTVFVDIESDGIRQDCQVIQLAAVAIDQDWNECEAFEQKVKFDTTKAEKMALEINGWTAEKWKDAVQPSECVRRFSAFLKPHSTIEMMSKRTGQPYMVARLAGYNILGFDLPRLRALYGEAFFPASYHVRDVLQRAMWFFDEHTSLPKPKDLKLSSLVEYFGIDSDGSHEALADVRATVSLAKRLVNG